MVQLEKLFSSKVRVKLLKTFLLNEDEEYFVRELTRLLDEQINSIRRELDNLKKIGLLKSRAHLRKKYFYLNKEFLLFPELRNIITKSSSNFGEMAVELGKIGQINLLLLTGIFKQDSSSPVDILIIGEFSNDILANYIKKLEKKFQNELKYAVMTKEDYLFRKNCQDRFIKGVLESPYTIAFNNLKFDFKK